MTTDTSSAKDRHYLPAAGHDFFLPFYDLVAKILGVDRARHALLDQAPLKPGGHVLEIGCGTGSFLLMLKSRFPVVELTGLDPDPKALARARKKTERAGHSIRLDQGFADSLPYPAVSFDAVFSSFMFHHLEAASREKTLREVRRVLKPGAAFYLLDFEVSDSSHGTGVPNARPLRSMRSSGKGGAWWGKGFCLFHSRQLLRDNTAERILALLRAAGFPGPQRLTTVRLLSGHAACYQAIAPQ